MQDKRFLEFKELLNSGSLYDCGDPKMVSLQSELIERINRYNLTPDTVEGNKERIEILKEAMGNYGEGTVVLPPVRANWGLQNVFVGKNCFFNFNTIFVDDGEITIGDYCMFGPGCQIVTATHPISPELRKRNYQYNKPVHIGNAVWCGAGVIILPGVTIGDNSVIGAGSLVNKDVEPNSVVAGVPAKLIRKISDKDNLVYDRDKPIPEELVRMIKK